MSGFLYFVPNRRLTSKSELHSVGLDRVVDSPGFADIAANGPGGTSGTVIIDRHGGMNPIIQLEHQVWNAVASADSGEPRFWVGHFREDRPTQDSLVRDAVLPGQPVTLLDGKEWVIPVLREWRLADDGSEIVASTQLPRMISCDEQGRVCKGNVRSEYRSIWERSWDFHVSAFSQLMAEDDEVEMPLVDMYGLAVDILNLNYRVMGPEVRDLEILSTDEAQEIIRTALDWRGYFESAKNLVGRSEDADTSSHSGAERPTQEEATNIPTAQPLAS